MRKELSVRGSNKIHWPQCPQFHLHPTSLAMSLSQLDLVHQTLKSWVWTIPCNTYVTVIREWHGLQVPAGMGMGYDSPICQLSNEFKNIFFGPKLREIQPILQNSLKLSISPSFLGCFGLLLWVNMWGHRYRYCTGWVWVAGAIPMGIHVPFPNCCYYCCIFPLFPFPLFVDVHNLRLILAEVSSYSFRTSC